MLNRADHVNGAGWSNTFDRNMRQSNAHQRAGKTGPHGLNNAVTARGNNIATAASATAASASAAAAASASGGAAATTAPSFGADPNQYNDDEYAALTQLGVQLSLDHMNQQQHQTAQQTIQQQQHILQQFNNNDSLLSFASSANGEGNTSISPMPSTITKTSVPPNTFTSPAYKTKTCNALTDYMFQNEFGDGIDDDAVSALDAFENPNDGAHKTMHRVSKRLFDQNTKTPELAEKMVDVFKSLSKRQRKSD